MSYEIAGIVGDVNPLQYGGWLIARDSRNIDCLVIEPIDWEGAGKQGEGVDCLVYHVALDRMKVIGDVAYKTDVLIPYEWSNDWRGTIQDRTEWWDTPAFRTSIESSGIGWAEFVTAICHESPVQRAWAWREIGQYFGMNSLDDCPTRETEASLKKRFALPFSRARKRGITVYA